MNKQSGFTLIELLVTLLIISILVALIASSFALGLKSWTGVSKKVEAYQRVRVCIDMMSSRLQNAFISPLNKKLTFKGDRYSLSFVTTSSSKEGLTKVEFGAEKGLVEEFLGTEEFEQVHLVGEKSENVFLDKGIDSIEFMYYNPKDEQWKESWDSLNRDSSELMCLPLAVKISLTFSTSDDKVEKITIPEVVVMISGGMKPMKEQEQGEKEK
ncbi:MAG: prepilin-type N-terminal cleavage/methylation domain-containing protein [bacterium]|nr:prepilin-type N-terminal cleavage/methylation domain-containing protein [bacterium]